MAKEEAWGAVKQAAILAGGATALGAGAAGAAGAAYEIYERSQSGQDEHGVGQTVNPAKRARVAGQVKDQELGE